MTLRVLVTGDRDWSDPAPIIEAIEKLPADTLIIEGGARGADKIASDAAKARGLRVHTEEADWDKYHKAAGAIRNTKMLNDWQPTLVLGFHPDLKRSKGTLDMVTKAKAAGVEVIMYPPQEIPPKPKKVRKT